ncbi:hypothetical protein FRB93_000012 [Tulasnella sp. JGI-2019a]|nr:hypothetical protein FRB93_000012 [Tulasnella sp. JGI-2019a]
MRLREMLHFMRDEQASRSRRPRRKEWGERRWCKCDNDDVRAQPLVVDEDYAEVSTLVMCISVYDKEIIAASCYLSATGWWWWWWCQLRLKQHPTISATEGQGGEEERRRPLRTHAASLANSVQVSASPQCRRHPAGILDTGASTPAISGSRLTAADRSQRLEGSLAPRSDYASIAGRCVERGLRKEMGKREEGADDGLNAW